MTVTNLLVSSALVIVAGTSWVSVSVPVNGAGWLSAPTMLTRDLLCLGLHDGNKPTVMLAGMMIKVGCSSWNSFRNVMLN